MPSVLEVQNLTRAFRIGERELQVLKGISFATEAAEFVAVMGQSGSGKSSLLHIIAGLLPATAGSVKVDGMDVTTLDDAGKAALRRERLGYVFQNFNLMPQLTAEENVVLPLRINGVNPSQVAERTSSLLHTMQLWDRRDHSPHQLSGGELQRLSVARALITEPPLILADEPTGNLSSQAGQEVMRLLREAVDQQKRSVLMVTHNPYDAAKADRVLFLKDGTMNPKWTLSGKNTDATAVLDRLKELGI